MQEQAKRPKKPIQKKAPKKVTKKKPVARPFKQLGNNPYSSVPLKERNVSPSSGFSFPGAV